MFFKLFSQLTVTGEVIVVPQSAVQAHDGPQCAPIMEPVSPLTHDRHHAVVAVTSLRRQHHGIVGGHMTAVNL